MRLRIWGYLRENQLMERGKALPFPWKKRDRKKSAAIMSIQDRKHKSNQYNKGQSQRRQNSERKGSGHDQGERPAEEQLHKAQFFWAFLAGNTHVLTPYEIFIASAPDAGFIFVETTVTNETCLCGNQHSAEHHDASSEGPLHEFEACDRQERLQDWKKKSGGKDKYRLDACTAMILGWIWLLLEVKSHSVQANKGNQGWHAATAKITLPAVERTSTMRGMWSSQLTDANIPRTCTKQTRELQHLTGRNSLILHYNVSALAGELLYMWGERNRPEQYIYLLTTIVKQNIP